MLAKCFQYFAGIRGEGVDPTVRPPPPFAPKRPGPIRERHCQFDVEHPSHQGDEAAVEYIKRDADDYSGERMRGRGVEGQPDP